MDFYLDMLRDARGYLRVFGHRDADTLSNDDVVVACFRMFARLPEPRPRTFERPADRLPTLNAEEQVGLLLLQQEVEQGEPLWLRLSRTLLFQSADPLFNDWGIYHFHLGTALAPNGFVRRTNHAAFAVLDGDRFLLLGVLPHTPHPYEDTDLLRVWQANWPESIARFQVSAVPEPRLVAHSNNAASIQMLRKRGINVPIIVDGVAYLPMGGGVLGDGGSMNALRDHDKMARNAQRMQQAWAQQFPGHPGRFRVIDGRYAVVQHPDGHLWHWGEMGFTQLPEGMEQNTLTIFSQLGLD